MDVHDLTIRHVEVQTSMPSDDLLERFEAQLGRHDPAGYFPLLTDPSHAEEVPPNIRSQIDAVASDLDKKLANLVRIAAM